LKSHWSLIIGTPVCLSLPVHVAACGNLYRYLERMQRFARLQKTADDYQIPATLLKIFTPVLLTIVLFVGTFFGFILPSVESQLMDRKRETILALTQSAWSTIGYHADLAQKGVISAGEAKQRAATHLRSIRYGAEGEGYFWINDMHPHIVMHPYRPELEGRDVSDFTDPNGKRLFAACADIVRRQGAGFVDYQWQWLDKPDKIVPKISYVKGFQPWGWVVGTGVYVEDVRSQIVAITQRWTIVCLLIMAIIVILGVYAIFQGAKAERIGRRIKEQASLHQEQLYQSAKMASLGTLVSGVAHEINNPIATVMLNLQVFEKFWRSSQPVLDDHFKRSGAFAVGGMPYPQLKERLPRLLRDAREGVDRVKRIVGDLKEFGGIHPSDSLDDVDLNSVVEKALGLVRSLIKKTASDLQIHLASGLPAIYGNSQRIEQVAVNLLVNACQAATAAPMALRVTTGFEERHRELFLRIEDTGIGMTPEVMERVADPFFTTKRNRGGTGLGLSISHTIVRDHGGRMEFESQPGQGTTATIYLPAKENGDPLEQSHDTAY
jgi:signal transduction histidine kinase